MELALSMHHRFGLQESDRQFTVTLVSRSSPFMNGHNDGVRRIFRRVLKERGITLLEGVEVSDSQDVDGGRNGAVKIRTSPKSSVDGKEFDFVVWCGKVKVGDWVKGCGMDLTNGEGFFFNNALRDAPIVLLSFFDGFQTIDREHRLSTRTAAIIC